MPVQIKQLHRHFVGEVSGVDLTKPLSRDEARDIEAGMDRYAVLVFHGQDITDEQQMAFALNFGERENPRGGNIVKPQDSRLSTGLNDVSNLGKDGKPCRPTAGSICSTSAIACGIPTRRSGRSRRILAAVGAGGEPEGRQHRIRRHARGL